jgi:hypothetical protein
MNTTKLELPADLAQAITDYLSLRPFREVANLMAGMMQLKPIEPQAEVAKVNTTD